VHHERTVHVKICGITSQGDLEIALGAGTSAVGFLVGLVHPSVEQLEPEQAAELIRRVPPFVTSVLVTHSSEPKLVDDFCAIARPAALQLQGDFPLAEIAALRRAHPALRIIKAIHVTGPEAIEHAALAAPEADAILLDSRSPGRLGGTGLTHDWSISRAIRQRITPVPLILAGGLRPENVRSAIERVAPFAVDVNSGVSVRPGVKDAARLHAFMREARAIG
jgi:phosphoribosylanthranilate isomerase